jgi:hypothetical protein
MPFVVGRMSFVAPFIPSLPVIGRSRRRWPMTIASGRTGRAATGAHAYTE